MVHRPGGPSATVPTIGNACLKQAAATPLKGKLLMPMIHGQKEKKKRILYSQKREIVEVHGTQPGSKKNYKTRVKASSRASRL